VSHQIGYEDSLGTASIPLLRQYSPKKFTLSRYIVTSRYSVRPSSTDCRPPC